MGITYDDDAGDLVMEGDDCPHCSSQHTYFDFTFRHWKCEDCSFVWQRILANLDEETSESVDMCPKCIGEGRFGDEIEGFTECSECEGTGYVCT